MECPGTALVVLLCLAWNAVMLPPAHGQACTVPPIVDFENCLWSNSLAGSSGYDWNTTSSIVDNGWVRHQASGLAFNVLDKEGIAHDHSVGSRTGYYVAAERYLRPSIGTASASFESPEYSVDQPSACTVSFYYQLATKFPSDHLLVSFINGTANITGANLTVTTQHGWTLKTVSIPTGMKRFRIVFETHLVPNNSVGFASLDDVSFSSSCCRDFRTPLRTDFECGLGGYTIHDDGTDSTVGHWNYTKGGTITSRPVRDATLGRIQEGHFLTAVSLSQKSMTASFTSPVFEATSSCRMTFWYQRGTNGLDVWLENTQDLARQSVWSSRTSPPAVAWTQATVNIVASTSFRLVYVANITTNPVSNKDVSIDDIAFDDSCWSSAPAPAPANYGLPGSCNWIGYDTISMRISRDKFEAVLLRDLPFPCNGTVKSWTAYTDVAASYIFHIVKRLGSVSKDPAIYVQIKSSVRVLFPGGPGQQTGRMLLINGSTAHNISFEEGDLILFERQTQGSSVDGSVKMSHGVDSSACATSFPIAQLTAFHPTTSEFSYKFPGSYCTLPNQFALRVDFYPDGSSAPTIPTYVSSNPPAAAATTHPPVQVTTTPETTDQVSSLSDGTSPPSTTLAPASATSGHSTTAPGPGATQRSSVNILPYAIAGGGVAALFIILAILALCVLCKKRRVGKVSIYQTAAVFPAGTVDREGSGRPVVNQSYEEEIRLTVEHPTVLFVPSEHTRLNNHGVAEPPTVRAMTNGRTSNGRTANGHAQNGVAHQHLYASTSHSLDYAKRPAERVQSNSTDTTMISDRSTPSDTSSPQRADGDNVMPGALAAGVTDTADKPPIPGDSGSGTVQHAQPPASRHHIYYLPADVSDQPGHVQTPVKERTIMVEVASSSPPKIRPPVTDYQEPMEDLEQGSEGTLSSEFRSSFRYSEPPSNIRDMYAHLNSRTYQRLQPSQVELQTEVGKGEFGTVYAGVWHRISADVHVAIKILQGSTSEKERVRFLREAAIMGQFSHRNIVKLIGVVAEIDPLYIVLELMQDNLKNYLKSLRPGMPTSTDFLGESLPQHLLGMCKDVASGMAYLDHKGFIHRDLAARNVMIDSERVCKVGDFGLARDLDGGNNSYYVSQGGKVPIKWTAPEAIFFRKYSSASDVWSYGILLYEIWSLAAEPYAWWDNKETFEKVKNGYRLSPPAGCPLNMYEMMIQCWHPDPHQRPSFQEILRCLDLTDQDHLLLVTTGLGSNVLGSGAVDLTTKPSHYRTLQQRFAGESLPEASNDQITAV